MKSQILALVKQLGPIVPNEITSRLQSNSMIISALLSELIKEGELFYSHKKIGSSPLYYTKGQEEAVRKRLAPELKIPENKIIEFFEEKKLVLRDNLAPQQRFMVDGLRDFITPITLTINGEEKIFYKHHSIPAQAIYDELNKKNKPKVEKRAEPLKQQSLFGETKTEEKKTEKKRGKKVIEAASEFDDLSEKFFEQYNMSKNSFDVVKKAKEANFTVAANYKITQRYYVKYYKKKSVNENDISKAYAEAQLKKMPCIIITTGKINKKGQEILSSLGSLINVIKL